MKELIGFEVKKFYYNKKNWIVTLLLVVVLLLYIVISGTLEIQLNSSEIDTMEGTLESTKEELKAFKEEEVRLPDNEEIKKAIKWDENAVVILNKMCKAYKKADYMEYLRNKIQYDRELEEHLKWDNVFSVETPEEVHARVELESILLEKKIKPIKTEVSVEAFNFMVLLLNNPASIILILLVIILSADVVSSEFESRSYQLLYTQPISKLKIFFSKLIATIINVQIVIFTIIGACFLGLGFMRGFGDINYPTLFCSGNGAEYISVGKFIIYGLVMLITLTCFICVLSVTISSFSKSTSNAIGIAVIVPICGYMIATKGLTGSLVHLNPFTYFDISSLLQGLLMNLFENTNLNFSFALAFLLGMTFFFLLINIIYIKIKK